MSSNVREMLLYQNPLYSLLSSIGLGTNPKIQPFDL